MLWRHRRTPLRIIWTFIRTNSGANVSVDDARTHNTFSRKRHSLRTMSKQPNTCRANLLPELVCYNFNISLVKLCQTTLSDLGESQLLEKMKTFFGSITSHQLIILSIRKLSEVLNKYSMWKYILFSNRTMHFGRNGQKSIFECVSNHS